PAEFSIDGEADHLTLELSQDTISNDGTADTHLIVTMRDKDGNWVNQNANVTLEVLDGPGVFPIGKIFTLKSGNTLRDGKGAIEFRSFYAGTTIIQATAADLEPVEITVVTKDVTGDETGDEPDGFMESGSRDNTPKIEDPGTYGGVSFSANRPTFSSSGDAKLANDGDMTTSWVAKNAGSGEYWMQDLEQSPLLYKVKLSFDRDPYPYRLEVSGDKNGPWTEVVSYDADTVKNRPYEESLPGTYARFVRVVFTGVPEDKHAFLTEAAVYAVDSTQGPMPDEQPDLSYATGSVYVSDLQPAKPITQGWTGKTPGIDVSIEGNPIRIAGTEYAKGLGLHANSEAVYELDGRYARFQAVIGIDDEVSGTGDAIYRIYATAGNGDDAKEQLIYEAQISSGQAEKIDLSIRGVTKLRLVTDANGVNSNDHTDWADAKLLGAVRNMTNPDSGYIVSMSSNTQGLEAGKTFEAYLSLKNNGASNIYGASLALYNPEGKLV
ncbi:NPCBM/NEW2 domain-containing protein, partial [Blautia wexlerae]|nr:NPCBM/NEW2 domain-containing protein [Blautia wexlerae]